MADEGGWHVEHFRTIMGAVRSTLSCVPWTSSHECASSGRSSNCACGTLPRASRSFVISMDHCGSCAKPAAEHLPDHLLLLFRTAHCSATWLSEEDRTNPVEGAADRGSTLQRLREKEGR